MNPLCWAAFFLMNRDMEMSCDEDVLAREENAQSAYSAALLDVALSQRPCRIWTAGLWKACAKGAHPQCPTLEEALALDDSIGSGALRGRPLFPGGESGRTGGQSLKRGLSGYFS